MKKTKTIGEKLREQNVTLSDIARKYDTSVVYVWQIAHELRSPKRGKGLLIKKDLEILIKPKDGA